MWKFHKEKDCKWMSSCEYCEESLDWKKIENIFKVFLDLGFSKGF